MAPGGRQPVSLEEIQNAEATSLEKKSPKSQPQCVSNSEAASGPHTSPQGTDALTSLPGSRYQTTRTTDTHPRGGSLGRDPPP